MGFEVIYHYKELADENVPGVYKEEIKTKTSKIGKSNDEVSFEVLASKILSQLARRNILIINFEIFEFVKKKINFKETDDGIVIKNKKYKFDGKINSFIDLNEIEDENDDQDQDQEIDVSPCSLKQSKKLKPKNSVLRYEYFDPEIMSLHKAKQKGLKFTQGKKYPICSEENMGSTIIYCTIDDSDKEVKVSSEYFSAAPVAASSNKDIDLWSRYNIDSEVPDIR